MTLNELSEAVRSDNAIHFSTMLVGSDADPRPDGKPEPSIVAPATYAKNKEKNGAFEDSAGARISVINVGSTHEARTVLNSVGAEAHRLKSALKAGLFAKPFPYPGAKVVGNVDGTMWELDLLDAPHGSSDAYFRLTDEWQQFNPWRMGPNQIDLRENLTAMYRRSPSSLVFGGWNSYEQVASRLPRAFSSSINGITTLTGATSSASDIMVTSKAMRTDPLIKGEQLPLPEALRKARDEKKAKAADKDDKNNISAVGLGDILAKGFTGHVLVDYAMAKSTLSLAALRVYCFPLDGVRTPDRDLAGRTVVAALALLTYELGSQRGFFLRSGCSLVPYGPQTRVIIGSDGVRRPLPGDVAGPSRVEAARELYIAAVAAAAQHGLEFDDDQVLHANKSLNEVMAKSTRLEGVTPEDEVA